MNQEPLTWRTEPPDKPGWWWVRHGKTVACIKAYDVDEELSADFPISFGSVKIEWAGPIPEPQEPRGEK